MLMRFESGSMTCVIQRYKYRVQGFKVVLRTINKCFSNKYIVYFKIFEQIMLMRFENGSITMLFNAINIKFSCMLSFW